MIQSAVMDEFEELSGSEAAGAAPAPALVDPASEFLEREKEELGDVLGETQGMKVLDVSQSILSCIFFFIRVLRKFYNAQVYPGRTLSM